MPAFVCIAKILLWFAFSLSTNRVGVNGQKLTYKFAFLLFTEQNFGIFENLMQVIFSFNGVLLILPSLMGQ